MVRSAYLGHPPFLFQITQEVFYRIVVYGTADVLSPPACLNFSLGAPADQRGLGLRSKDLCRFLLYPVVSTFGAQDRLVQLPA